MEILNEEEKKKENIKRNKIVCKGNFNDTVFQWLFRTSMNTFLFYIWFVKDLINLIKVYFSLFKNLSHLLQAILNTPVIL